ncbi:MAG: MogA/MoaB family molybdenum cofactor biosynthesis protein [Acidimicrobiia bacterium]
MSEASFAAKVLTVSDGVAEGVREDKSGDAVVTRLEAAGAAIVDRAVAADGVEEVAHALRTMSRSFAGLLITTGGTGFGPRDCTPEGTRKVIQTEAPGLVEAIRRVSDADGRGFGMLSRAVAGTIGECLIVNTPGSSSGAVEALDVILPVLPHALDLLAGGHPH